VLVLLGCLLLVNLAKRMLMILVLVQLEIQLAHLVFQPLGRM